MDVSLIVFRSHKHLGGKRRESGICLVKVNLVAYERDEVVGAP